MAKRNRPSTGPGPGEPPLSGRFSPYVRLKDMIYRGGLPAGQRLVERELARKLEVSRIPLREALVRLQAEGLVRSIRHSASYVVDFSPWDLAEIYSLRRVLEPFAARLAAERCTPELVAALEALCRQMRRQGARQGGWDRLDDCDYAFHWTVVQASGHARLIRAYELSQVRILGRRDEFRYLARVSPARLAESHLKLVRALACGDPARAERAAFDHVDRSMQAFLRSHNLTV